MNVLFLLTTGDACCVWMISFNHISQSELDCVHWKPNHREVRVNLVYERAKGSMNTVDIEGKLAQLESSQNGDDVNNGMEMAEKRPI